MGFICSVIVSSGYLLLSLVAIIQLFRILLYGHKLLSFATYFLLLSLSWAIMRCAYFGFGYIYFTLNERDNLLLFYCPTVLQFATFSFILVYYEKHMKQQHNWRLTKHYIIFIYILSTLFLATINIISLFIYCYDGWCTQFKTVNKIYYVSFSIFYMLLLIFYCIYVRRLWKQHNLYIFSPKNLQQTTIAVNNRQNNNNNTETNGTEPYLFPQISQLASSKHLDQNNVTLHGKSKALFSSKFVIFMFVIFVTRCLYYFILSIGVFINVLNEQNNDMNDIGIAGLLSIIFWEWLPTFLIIFFFRTIPSTNLCCPLCNCCCVIYVDNDKNTNGNSIKRLISYNKFNQMLSTSDTSQSIPDISYFNKSPPAPIIQKLIYQQQQTHSLQSRTMSPMTPDIVNAPSKNNDHVTF